MIEAMGCIDMDLALEPEVGSLSLVYDSEKRIGQVALIASYDIATQIVVLGTPAIMPTSTESMPLETFLDRTRNPETYQSIDLLGPSYGARFGTDGMLIQSDQQAA